MPGLRKRLGRQVERGGVRTRLALEPRPYPCGIAVVELAEGEGILARGGEQVGIGSDLVVRSGSKRFATRS
jgi:hypothetical protein